MAINNVKFQPPSQSSHSISRQPLLQRLDQKHYRLVICHAPAGFGKTTFMSEYFYHLENKGEHAAWFSLDDSDNDLARFIKGVESSLTELGAAQSQEVDKHNGSRTDLWDWLITTLSDSTMPRYLFLDNFESIDDPSILDTLSLIFQRIPKSRQIIIGSRRKTELQYSKLRLENDVCILRADDFRFSSNESAHFFEKQHLLQNTETSNVNFVEQLNGWPTAHTISALQLKHGRVQSENPTNILTRDDLLTDYVGENILNNLETGEVDFLLKTCLLDSLDSAVCNSLAGINCADSMLEKLYQEDLFIHKIQTDPPQYRYHKLFSEILYEHYIKDHPEGLDQLHKHYYHVLLEHQRPEEAINHALKLSDPSLAANLIREQALQAIYKSEINRVLSWVEALPDAEIKKSPDLLLAYAWAAAFTHNFTVAKECIEYFEQHKKNIDASNEVIYKLPTTKIFYLVASDQIDGTERLILKYLRVIPSDAHFERTAINNLLCYLYVLQSRFESARKIMLTTQSIGSEHTQHFTVTYSYALLGMSQFLQGDLENAKITLETGQKIAKRLPNGSSLARSATAPILAAILYEQNSCDAAKALLEKHLPYIRNAQLADWIICSYVTLSRCYFQEENYSVAQRLIDDLERLGYSNDNDRIVYTAQKELVFFHQRLKQLERAELVGEAIDVMDSGFRGIERSHFPSDMEANSITDIRQAILTQQYDEAEQRILIARQKTHKQRRLRIWKLDIMEALLAAAQQKLTRSATLILGVLNNPGASDLCRIFIDEGETMKIALSHTLSCTKEKALLEKIKSLLTLFQHHAPAEPKIKRSKLIEPLTKRELELLQLVAAGLGNKSIADKTFVSESTVKWHLGNVFSKLGVKKRTQAIMTGRQLGLIE